MQLFADSWEEPEADPDGPEAEFAESAMVSCPYCGEGVEIYVDQTGGSDQRYVEDCEVCCRPWAVHVTLDPEGGAHVSVSALDSE